MVEPSLISLSPSDFVTFESSKKESHLSLINKTPSPVAFKVKTSSPKNFLVNPTNGIISANSTVSLRISLVNLEEALMKSHKFLIQVRIANDINSVNWNSPGTEDYKISAKIVMSEAVSVKEEIKVKEVEPEQPKESTQSFRASKVTFQVPESLKDELSDKGRKTLPTPEVVKDILVNPDKNKKILSTKANELTATIENLKAEIEKASGKLRFSRELDQLTLESVGKYSLAHLLAAFVCAFLLAYYIF